MPQRPFRNSGSNTSNLVADASGTTTLSDDSVISAGTVNVRIQERIDMLGFNSKADTTLSDPAPINSTRHAAFPVTFTANAADHGTNMRYFAPANTAKENKFESKLYRTKNFFILK